MNIKSASPNIPNQKISQIRNAFKDLKFMEKSHKYKVGNQTLVSVTTYISRFHPEFEGYHISKALEKKYSRLPVSDAGKARTHSYFLKRWKLLADEASSSGSRVHEYIEYNAPYFHETPACAQEKGAIEFFSNLPQHYQIACFEKRVYSLTKMLAGTIDCILYNSQTNKFVIVDWKTNKKNLLQYYNDSNLVGPFGHLKDTSLNIYSVQLSLYKSIIEELTGIEVEDCWIIHLSNGDWTQIDNNKLNSPNADKYAIDDVTPDMCALNYRQYRVTDYSQIISQFITDERNNRI